MYKVDFSPPPFLPFKLYSPVFQPPKLFIGNYDLLL